VLSLAMDREGSLWVGMNGGGLARVKRHLFEVLESSRGATVQSLAEDVLGGLWVGYNDQRIDRFADGHSVVFTDFQAKLDLHTLGPMKCFVRSVFVDQQQQVWAGTVNGGLLRLSENKFRQAQGPDLLRRDVSALYQDSMGRLWAGTEAGLAGWDGSEWSRLTAQEGLPPFPVRALAEDGAKGLWIGTDGGGVVRWQAGRFEAFTRTNGLPSDNITALLRDRKGVLWVGTSSGLCRFAEGRWTSYAGRLGPAGDSIAFLLEDNLDHLWLGTTAGLLRVAPKELADLAAGLIPSVAPRLYGRAEGLPSPECTQGSQPAACRTRDGRVWFPTIKGLVSVDPAQLKRNTNPPPVMIEAVYLDGRRLDAGTLGAAPLREVTVPPGSQALEIRYTSLNLAAPDKARFRYRLNPHETDWTEVESDRRVVRYPRLPPGRYRFEVTAGNEDGVWNPAGMSLGVIVQPPFWRTWWFLTLASLALLGAIIGSVHYVSTQKLQRQLSALRQQEALEKERARIARDLHDQLGANLTQVALLGEMAEADKDLPAEIESHARQIAQTARETTRALDEIVWTVNPANDTLDGLINYLCKYAQEYLALAGLQYRLEVPPQLPATPISPELRHNVFLVAKEAINNIVKHSRASAARLRLRLAPDQFTLEIEDNGQGLPPGAENKGRNGLRNMRRRMEEIAGQFQTGPGAEGGVCIRLVVPLRAPGRDGKEK
jgi:signal transduction histidine kinase/streptogramin lyase